MRRWQPPPTKPAVDDDDGGVEDGDGVEGASVSEEDAAAKS